MSRSALLAALLVFALFGCGHAAAPKPVAPVGAATFAFDDVATVDVDWSRDVPNNEKEPARATLATIDGRALAPKRLDVRAAIYGPLAFTELHFTFATDLVKVDDAYLTLNLPSGASVARVALRVGEDWEEAEVVDRPEPRRTEPDPIDRPIDSDVTEMFLPQPLRVHLTPVRGAPANTEVVIAYTEVLRGSYRVLLHELPALEALDVQVLVAAEKKAYVLHRRNEAPRHDLELPRRRAPGDRIDAARGGDFAIVRVEPAEAAPSTGALGDAVLLIDSSASRAKTYDPDLYRLERAVAALTAKGARFTFAAFDQDVVPVASIAEAKTRRPGGATDYARALAWAKAHGKRALVFTDGHDTPGKPIANSGLERVDAIGAGAVDLAGLRALSESGATPGAVVLPDEDPALVATAATEWFSNVEVNGTKVAVADRVTFAFVEEPGGLPLTVAIDGAEARPVTNVVAAPTALVERAVIADRIAHFGYDEEAELATLAKRYRIATGLTSFLLLGGERAQYKVPAEATERVLAVTAHGVVSRARGRAPSVPPRPATALPNLPAAAVHADRGLVVIDSDYDFWLQRISFPHGSSELAAAEGQSELLDSTVRMIGVKDDVDVLGVYGHTDETEAPALGQARAERVRDELVKRGFDPRRIVVKNWGATRPNDPAKTEEAREKNRRVDFRILAMYGRATGVEDSIPAPLLLRDDGKVVRYGEPYRGELATVLGLFARKKTAEAIATAEAWVDWDRSNALAWMALGRVLTTSPDAARAYGSLVDLATSPGELRVAAGFLESIGAFDRAVEAYVRAAERDPRTNPNALRLLAWATARQGRRDVAFAGILRAAKMHFDEKRWPGVDRVLARDVGLLAAMYARERPAAERAGIFRDAKDAGAVGLELATRFAILTWETDDDLDLVGAGKPDRPLLSPEKDVAAYGPELLLPDAAHPGIEVHLLHRERRHERPIAGKVTVFTHDGRGKVDIQDLPFVLNAERGRVVLSH